MFDRIKKKNDQEQVAMLGRGPKDGDDVLIGDGDDNFLIGGDGDDILSGGLGNDVLLGGDGSDRYLYSAIDADGSVDTIRSFETGAGNDILDLSGLLQGASRANLADFIYVHWERGRTYLSMDVDGDGSGFDDLTIEIVGLQTKTLEELGQLIADGNVRVSEIIEWRPGDGDREIEGGDGEDVLSITLPEGLSEEEVTVTPLPDGRIQIVIGDDTVILDGIEEIDIEGAEGDNTIIIAGDFSSTDLAPSTIKVRGRSGDDTIDAANYESGHNLDAAGRGGDDTIIGGAGDDRLRGDGGNDFLSGGIGDDYLEGGDGTDTLDGGEDNDLLLGGTGDDSLNGGSGYDIADFSAYSIIGYDISLGGLGGATIDDVDTLDGDSGTDVLTGIEEVQFSDRTIYLDGRNNQPIANDESFFLDENLSARLLGFVSADDVDGDALSYRILSGNEGGLFAIDAETGGLYTTGPLDFEDFARHKLVIEASDPEGLKDSFRAVIDVGNVADADDSFTPVRLAGSFEVDVSGIVRSIAALPDGGFLVAYQDDGLFIQRFDALGDAVGETIIVDVPRNGITFTAGDLAVLPDGSFAITHSTANFDAGLFAPEPLATLYDSSGSLVRILGGSSSPYFSDVNPTTADFVWPTIAALSSNSYLAVAPDRLSIEGLTTSSVVGQRIAANGDLIGDRFVIASVESANDQWMSTPIEVTVLSTGGYVVSWRSIDGPAVSMRVYDSGGVAVGAVQETALDGLGYHGIAALEDGRFIVAWRSSDGGLVRGQLYDAAGDTVGSELVISTQAAQFLSRPDITVLSDGGFLVTWDSASTTAEDVILARRFSPNGTAQGEEFQIGDGLGFQSNPQAALLEGGEIAVVWTDRDGSFQGTGQLLLAPDFTPGPTDHLEGVLYLTADDPSHGIELWSYDGLTLSRTLDLFNGSGNSLLNGSLIEYNGSVFYNGSERDGHLVVDWGLVEYDGSAITHHNGAAGLDITAFLDPFVHDGTLFFRGSATDGTTTTLGELFKFDGTTVSLVADIYVGTNSSGVNNFVSFAGDLYFTVRTATTGFELFKYDGVDVTLVQDISPGSGSSSIRYFEELDGVLYFAANNGTTGLELFKYDGTTVSLIADLYQGNRGFVDGSTFTVFDGDLYFEAQAFDGASSTGFELFKYDPDSDTITQVSFFSSNPRIDNLTVFNGALYFSAIGNNNEEELYRYDGVDVTLAADTTVPVGWSSAPDNLTLYDGSLIYTAWGHSGSEITGVELYRFDGTTATLISDLSPGVDNSDFSNFRIVEGDLYFTADTTEYEDGALYRYDGTAVTAIGALEGNASADFWEFTAAGGEIYGTGYIEGDFKTLVRADGGDGEIITAFAGWHHVEYRGALYGAFGDETTGIEFGLYDGTTVTILDDIYQGAEGSFGEAFWVYDDAIFFQAEGFDGTNFSGWELYRYDGTEVTLFADLSDGSRSSRFGYDMIEYNGSMYFHAEYYDGTSNRSSIFEVNGTTLSTVADIDIRKSFSSFDVEDFVEYNGVVYFTGFDPATGYELYQFDGASVSLATELRSGTVGGDPRELTIVNGKLYFYANGEDEFGNPVGSEIFSYDGTTASLVEDLYLNGSANPRELTAVGNELFFTADSFDGTTFIRDALFSYDGTSITVHDFASTGLLTGQVFNLEEHNGALYFSSEGYDEAGNFVGRELFGYDNGEFFLVADVMSGTGSSNPESIVSLEDVLDGNDYLAFAATTDQGGQEMYLYDGLQVFEYAVAPDSLGYDPDNLVHIDPSLLAV